MKQSFKTRKTSFLICLFFIYSLGLLSQSLDQSIVKSYTIFSSLTREVVYIHLNKSVYIKNETVGFAAYVFDKSRKTPLQVTKNLYCTVSDKNGKIVKQKLIKVDEGLAHNTFIIDDKFKTGEYTFRALTNWMFNFNERNYYEQTFLVLESNQNVERPKNKNKYIAQVYPEGGHLVANTKNTLGIIVKNKK